VGGERRGNLESGHKNCSCRWQINKVTARSVPYNNNQVHMHIDIHPYTYTQKNIHNLILEIIPLRRNTQLSEIFSFILE